MFPLHYDSFRFFSRIRAVPPRCFVVRVHGMVWYLQVSTPRLQCSNKDSSIIFDACSIASPTNQNKISPLCSASNPRSCIFPFRRLSMRLRSSSSFFFSSKTSATGASWKGGGTISSLSRSYLRVSHWECVQDCSRMSKN